ncbi:uncharacterized protein C8Q71DRAFT_847654 [Rhodofomes roseus]|uniref:Uncharacterized protein n=1 Tax=Rhodofomes roseus TaxID=34475 RepID=A0ABQ8KIR8_9APHY|nr:uncharacterized protein C8Q71DRAFT_847654 [Rhodofomes roseus]KAH9837887.1 hypothetical protein C8Q71DRAFT_847654 [Rhodofomes roseus]
MILDNKVILTPPPPYAAVAADRPPSLSQPYRSVTLSTLPPYILLRIVYDIFPQGRPKGQRRILYWLTVNLRRVSRGLYVACMHVLRSTYLPVYTSLVHAPYSSDPFPMSAPDVGDSEPVSPVRSLQRETHILDLFIALKVREDVWADESELHLEREESFKDLFDLMQPRARLEDLVRTYGSRAGVVSVSGPPRTPSAPPSRCQTPTGTRTVPFNLVSVSFSPRKVGLVLATKQRRRTVAEVVRTRDQTLETSAVRLVRELAAWLSANPHYMTTLM